MIAQTETIDMGMMRWIIIIIDIMEDREAIKGNLDTTGTNQT